MDYKILMILFVFMIIGQLSEIQYQEVRFNDYAYQYALVQVIQDSQPHIIPCLDCQCEASFYDDKNHAVVENMPMVNLGSGLYGYIITTGEFKNNYAYRMEVLTYSPSLNLSGGVNSLMKVNNDAGQNSGLNPSANGNDYFNFDLCSYDLMKGSIFCADIPSFFNNMWTTFTDRIKLILDDYGLLDLAIWLKEIMGTIVGYLKTLWALWLEIVLNPIGFITNKVIPTIISIGWTLVLFYLVYMLVFETVILAYSTFTSPRDDYNKTDVLAVLQTWFLMHFKLIGVVLNFFYELIKSIMQFITMIANIVSSVNPISK